MVRTSAASPAGVRGGKNSKEISGRPPAKRSLTFTTDYFEPFFSSAFTFWYFR